MLEYSLVNKEDSRSILRENKQPQKREQKLVKWILHNGQFYHPACYESIRFPGSRSDYQAVYAAENENICVVCETAEKILTGKKHANKKAVNSPVYEGITVDANMNVSLNRGAYVNRPQTQFERVIVPEIPQKRVDFSQLPKLEKKEEITNQESSWKYKPVVPSQVRKLKMADYLAHNMKKGK